MTAVRVVFVIAVAVAPFVWPVIALVVIAEPAGGP